MIDKESLSLSCMAIGSLPQTSIEEAMTLIEKDFIEIPFWAQLPKISKNENMSLQFLENMPAIKYNAETDTTFIDSEDENIFAEIEALFLDFEEIIINKNIKVLDKYAISEDYSSTFNLFLDVVKNNKPQYAKGQIIGPFTLGTTLTDNQNKCVYYDVTLQDVIEKVLTLKALWQIREIKKSSNNTTPIIFIDEPALSQLKNSAYITINTEEVIEKIKNISDIIKEFGGISAIHCCGRCDWESVTKINTDIINFDAYTHFENFCLFSDSIVKYIKNGGMIAWGLIPTLNKSALEQISINDLKNNYNIILNTMLKKGLTKEEFKNHSIITPSCGCATLTTELATKAMDLTKELSDEIKE